jgi:hypothetical protein
MADQIPIRDLVPKELRKGENYDAVRGKMERNLACPDKVKRYATHESGHLLYLIKTGLISSPKDAIFEPPTIYLDDDGNVLQFSAAVSSNRIRLTDNTLVYTEEILYKASLASAAASEFEKALLGEDEDTAKAEAGDKGTLFLHCYKAMRQDGKLQGRFEGHTLWPSAQHLTAGWLQEDRTEVKGLTGIAKQIVLNQCFGLKMELSQTDFEASQRHTEIVAVLIQLLLELCSP